MIALHENGSRLLRALAVGLILVYQRCVSPFLWPSCRFYPSCSQYTRECVEKFGAVPGLWRGLKRLLRCHPLHPGGYDPVP